MSLRIIEMDPVPIGFPAPTPALQKAVLRCIKDLQHCGHAPTRPFSSRGTATAYRPFTCPKGVPVDIVHACFYRIRPTIGDAEWGMAEVRPEQIDCAIGILADLQMLEKVDMTSDLPVGSFRRSHDEKEIVVYIGKHPNFTPISRETGKELPCYVVRCPDYGYCSPSAVLIKAGTPISPVAACKLTPLAVEQFLNREMSPKASIASAGDDVRIDSLCMIDQCTIVNQAVNIESRSIRAHHDEKAGARESEGGTTGAEVCDDGTNVSTTNQSVGAHLGAVKSEQAPIHLKPSHARAKELYHWAMEHITGAENMTYAELFERLTNHPLCAGQGLPDNPEAFARYCRAAGIQRNTPRRGKGTTRSIRRISDL